MTHTLRCWFGMDDQQTGRFAVLSGTAPTFDASITSLSRYSIKWDGTAAGVTGSVQIYTLGFNTAGAWDTTAINSHWASFHFYIATLPVAATFFYLYNALESGGAANDDLRLRNDGVVEIKCGLTGTWETDGVVLSTGKWYVCSFERLRNSTLQFIIRDRDSGATVSSKTHSSACKNTAIFIIKLGPLTASRGLVHYDNWVSEGDNTDGNIDDPVTLLGTRYAVGLLTPTAAAGAYDAWTGSNADVDEFPQDGNTTSRSEATSGDAFTAPLTKSSGLVAQMGTIHGVEPFAFSRESAAGTAAQNRLRSASTDSDTVNFEPNNSATVYTPRQVIFLTDPATSGAWTVSALDSVEVGMERTDATDTVLCTEVGLEVLYTTTIVERIRTIAYMAEAWDPEQRIFDATGREVGLNEVSAIGGPWLRQPGISLPTSDKPASFDDQDDMIRLEATVYEADANGESLSVTGAPDDFVEMLSRRVQNIGGGV